MAIYVKFSLLQIGFESIIGWLREYFHLYTVGTVYIHVTSGDVGSGVADRDLQNI